MNIYFKEYLIFMNTYFKENVSVVAWKMILSLKTEI